VYGIDAAENNIMCAREHAGYDRSLNLLPHTQENEYWKENKPCLYYKQGMIGLFKEIFSSYDQI
jgi:hypothetical protein